MTSALKTWLADRDDPMPWRDVAITTLAIALPPLIAILIFGRVGAAAFMAALPAHIAARDRGLTIATLATGTTGFAGIASLTNEGLGVFIGPVLGVMVAAAGRHGYARPGLAALITWTVFTSPILPSDQPVTVFALYLFGMLASLAITAAFGAEGKPDDEDDGGRENRSHVVAFGVVLATGLAISIWVGTTYFGKHGFWFPLTFVVLLMPPHGQLFRRTVERTAGTLIGTALALAVAWVAGSTWVPLAFGAVALPLAFRAKPWSYTVFTVFLTIVVLELLTLTTEIDQLAVERLATMGAAAVMTFALGGLAAVLLRLFHPEAYRAILSAGT